MRTLIAVEEIKRLLLGSLLLAAALFSSASYAQSYPVSIRPPTTLTIDGQSITQGIFNLSGVTVFSDPGGVLTSQIILDPADPSDDVQKNPAIIGTTATKILVSVPDDSEVLLMEGFFDPVIPDLPIAPFKVILGAITPNGIPEFIWYLPTFTSNPTYTQISSVNGSGLGDNVDLFTLLGTNITLTDNDPAFPNHNFTPIGNGGVTNNWYVATPDSTTVPGAVPPLPANAVPVQFHGWAGCFGTPPVTSMAWAGGSGNWFSTNWDLGYGPDNGVLNCDYRVTVGGGNVTLDSSATVNTLEIEAGAEVDIQNGLDLTVVDGLFGNEGTLRFSSTGSITRFSITENTSLTGATGSFIFAPGLSPSDQRIELNGNSLSTQAGSVHTFSNTGRLAGSGVGVFGNNGMVGATGGQFEIVNVDFVNNGTLTTLAAGDEIILRSSNLTGGVVSTAAGSKIIADGSTTFDNVSNNGSVEVASSDYLIVESALSNNGTIEIASNTSSTELIVSDAVTLSGTGSIEFSGSNSNLRPASGFLDNDGVPDILTIANGASQTLSGDGEILGGDAFTIVNNGGLSIGAGPVDLDARLENNGSFVVQDGGELEVSSTGRIVGGNLETQGTGLVEVHFGTFDSVNVMGSVKVASSEYLVVESALSNNGTIEIASNTSSTELIVSDAVTLSGTGSIEFSGSNSNLRPASGFLDNDGVPDILTIANGASQTLSGDGEILGGDAFTIVNNGGLSIGAGPVDLDARLENNGSFVVQDGGELEVSSTGRIVGGTLETQGTGVVEIQQGTFEDVNSTGSVVVDNGDWLVVESGLSNNGTIEIASTGSSTEMIISDEVILSGTGVIVFSGGNANLRQAAGFLDNDGVADVLTIENGASQTISGDGQITGGTEFTMINNGGLSIGAGPVDLDARLENNGSLVVQDGGELEVSSTGRIVGGTLETQGTGVVEIQQGTFEDVNSTGSVVVDNGDWLVVESGLSNNGTIEIASTGSSTEMIISDEVTLSGTGAIVFSGGNANLRQAAGFLDNDGVADVLIIENGASQTISGDGQITGGTAFTMINNGGLSIGAGPVDLDARLENNGSLVVQDGGELEVSSSGSIVGGSISSIGSGILEGQRGLLQDVTSSGSIVVPNSQYLSLAGDIANDGTLTVSSTGSVTSLFINDAVTLSGNGSLVFSDSSSNRVARYDAQFGSNSILDILTIGADQTLSGVVTFNVPVINNGAISPGASPGAVTFNSTTTLTDSSNLIMEIDGIATNERDRIVVNGPLTLGGTLTLSIDPVFLSSLTASDQFEIINANAVISGAFMDVLPGERVIGDNGTTFMVDYGSSSVDPTAVMLKDFDSVSEEPGDSVESISGVAAGGTVTIVVNGVSISITTSPGDTSADVVAALAAAINAQFPGRARVIDNVLELTDLTIEQFTTTDTGLTLSSNSISSGEQCDPEVATRTISQLISWHILTVPCQSPAGSTMADLINDPTVSGDQGKWAAYTYSTSESVYVPLSASSAVPPAGTGFWFISTEEVTLTMPTGSAKLALANDAPCDSGQPCSEQIIEGMSGWNMIGNPLDMNVRYDEIQVTNDDLGCTDLMPCSLDQSSITSGLFFFEENSQTYRQYSSSVGAKSVARPWDGFWTYLESSGVDDDWTLHFRPYLSQFMFVTDEEYTADSFAASGGLGPGEAVNYADALCQAEADNAGLAGSYRAWLSDSAQAPSVVFNRLTTPYIRPDGVVIAASYVDLTDGNINTPISVSATLATPLNSFVWTATTTNGTALAAPNGIQPFCDDWSTTTPPSETYVGNSTAASASWTTAPQTVGCGSVSAHLYCSAQ